MTGLLWTMLKARSGIAWMTFLLTGVAVAASVTGPLYAASAMRSVIAVEVAAAPVSERLISADRLDQFRADPEFSGPGQQKDLEHQPYVHGFETYSGLLSEGNLEANGSKAPLWLASRTSFCEHLDIAEGRCAVADQEVVLRLDTANLLGLKPGSEVDYLASSFGGGPARGSVRLTVVGLYRAFQATDPYWADRVMFLGDTAPAFATERTLNRATGPIMLTTDLVAGREAFTDRDRLTRDTAQVLAVLEAAGFAGQSEVQVLAGRIDSAEQALLASLVVATLPLVAICGYVLFVAVSGAMRQRRPELAVTALRGVPPTLRWGLPGGETLIPVLLGGGFGVIFGYLVSLLLSATLLPGRPSVTPTWLAFGLGAAATLAAMLAGLLTQASTMREGVLELLQRVRRRRREGAVRAVEVLFGALAVAAGYQAATSDADGVAVLVPLCFALGCGLLAGRLVLKPMELVGRRLSRSGRLTSGLAALSLARRPGSRALVALLTVGFGLLGFALAAADTAERAWDRRARVETGAHRAVSVNTVPASRLLQAVRAVDPDGRFAMAAIEFKLGDSVPILAADTTRLAAIADWPADVRPGLTPQRAAALLRPTEPKPVMVQGSELVVEATLNSILEGSSARIELNVLKPDGRSIGLLGSAMTPGTGTYRIESPDCAERACRLISAGISLAAPQRQQVSVTLHALNGDRALFTGADTWLQQEETSARPVAKLEAGPRGITVSADSAIPVDMRLRVNSASPPLPVVYANSDATLQAPAGLASPEIVPVSEVARTQMLPRLGATGMLMDLEYADLILRPRAENFRARVLLGPDAPADVVQRLRTNGLAVSEEVVAADRYALYSQQGPALALRFLRIASLAALLLAACGLLVGAVLDRSRDPDGLAMLVPHGVPRGRIYFGAFLGRAALVLIATVAGVAAAVASWVVGRRIVPVFPSALPDFPVDTLPTIGAASPLPAATLLLLAACWLAARIARSSTERTET